MASENFIKELKSLADLCTADEPTTLVKHKDWGAINFEICRPEIERVYQALNQFKLLPVELLPDQQIQQIINALKPFKETLLAIKGFKIEVGSPTAERDNLSAQIKAQADTFFNASHLYIPYLAYQKGDVQRNISELTRSVEDAAKLVENTKIAITNRHNEMEGIISAAREASASVGVAHFSADFQSESNALESSAKNWLIATALAAGITFAVAIGVLFITVEKDATAGQVLQLFTSKVVILGLLITATVWCGRMYKAAKHQSSVNKHRSNALRTFQAFTRAASDDGIRDAVLMETTKSIFAITPSGYLDGESLPDGGAKVVEVVRNASQTAAAIK